MAERTITLTCARCEQTFDRLVQRGPTPSYCPDCKLRDDRYGPCDESGCETNAQTKTPRPLCAKHLWRIRKFGTTNLVVATIECADCGEPVSPMGSGATRRKHCGVCIKRRKVITGRQLKANQTLNCMDCGVEYSQPAPKRPGWTKRCADCLDAHVATKVRPPLKCKHCGETFGDETTNRHTAYCSPACRAAGKEANILAMRARSGPCSVDDCDKPKRTPGAEFCEQHYIRKWRHGDENTVHVRKANGKCFHCTEPVGRKLKFCSIVCRRRFAVRAPGRELACVVCSAPLPELAFYGTLYCSNPCERTAQRAKKYGVPPSQMHAFASAKSCQACGRGDVELVVDHCHDTGRLRGMLCSQCNVGIGMFADSQDRLRKAIAYLKRDADRNANGEQLILVG
jgi:hypothetical protein